MVVASRGKGRVRACVAGMVRPRDRMAPPPVGAAKSACKGFERCHKILAAQLTPC